jgi:hypothetical protein
VSPFIHNNCNLLGVSVLVFLVRQGCIFWSNDTTIVIHVDVLLLLEVSPCDLTVLPSHAQSARNSKVITDNATPSSGRCPVGLRRWVLSAS